MAEIEAMKNEKVSNQIKIRDLRDRLEESVCIGKLIYLYV